MLTFESLEAGVRMPNSSFKVDVKRAKVPGGWLVGLPYRDFGLTFVPDPTHTWDGNSLP